MPSALRLCEDLGGVVGALVADREDADLFGGEPAGECAGEVLDEHADEPFHRTERGAVDHDRSVPGVVGTDVFEIEALRQVVVDLHRPELPLAADDVLDHEVDLRAVEGGLSGLLAERGPEFPGRVATRLLGLVPVGGVADILAGVRITGADPDPIVGHAQGVEDRA